MEGERKKKETGQGRIYSYRETKYARMEIANYKLNLLATRELFLTVGKIIVLCKQEIHESSLGWVR